MLFDRVFNLLSVNDIFTLYTALMSEAKKIVFVSSNPQDLLPLNLVLTSFMHPFEWQLPRIPVGIVLEDDRSSSQSSAQLLNSLFPLLLGFTPETYELALSNIDEG